MDKFSRHTYATGGAAVIGCGYLILIAAFWIGVIAVAVHFIAKFW